MEGEEEEEGVCVCVSGREIMFPGLIRTHEGLVGQDQDLQVGGGGGPNHGLRGAGGDPCLVLSSDPKPRLRWTADLHERFVDAVTQLGGASSQSPFLSSACLLLHSSRIYSIEQIVWAS